MYKLKESTMLELNSIIDESQNSFLPTKDHPVSDPRGFLEYESKNPTFRLFALKTLKDEIVGYIMSSENEDDDIGTAKIGPMFISEKFRGKGLGELQVVLFIDHVKKAGFKKIKTKTWGSNKASNKIFQKFGFELYKTKLNDRVDGDSTVKYVLELDKL